MPKYKKKPVVIDAARWWKNGDHPEDDCEWVCPLPDSTTQFKSFLSEGKVVRYFRCPDVPGIQECRHCAVVMDKHGWIDTLEGGHIVCPGDWVITDAQGIYCSIRDSIFREIYEPAE